MPTETTHSGYVAFPTPPRELAEHGLCHSQNHAFFTALLDVVQLLRMEALMRECHPIHDKLVELVQVIRAEPCQDFVAKNYPSELME